MTTRPRVFLDCILAVFAAFSPGAALKSELSGFKSRIFLSGNSYLTSKKIELNRIKSEIDEYPSQVQSIKNAQIGILDIEIKSIGESIGEIEKEFNDSDSEDKKEEEEVQGIVKRWEKRLGRSAYVDLFNTYFEENIDRWMKSQPWSNSVSSSNDEDKGGKGDEDDNKDNDKKTNNKEEGIIKRIKLYISTYMKTLFKGASEARNIPKFFVITAMLPELVYSYTPFEVIVNGDYFAAVSGTIVFTVGIVMIGQMSGFAVLRSRYREGNIENSEPKWRFKFVFAACMLFLFGCYAVYAGATLRGTTGEVIRLKQEIDRAQGDQKEAEEITSIRNRMELLIKNPIPAYKTTEGGIAIFVYGIFFLSTLMSKIFYNDPVFEFGLATQWREKIRRRRLENKFSKEQYISYLRSAIILREKQKVKIEKQEISNNQLKSEMESLKEEISSLELRIEAYNLVRLRTFGNFLAKIRRKHANIIVDWLDNNSNTRN